MISQNGGTLGTAAKGRRNKTAVLTEIPPFWIAATRSKGSCDM